MMFILLYLFFSKYTNVRKHYTYVHD